MYLGTGYETGHGRVTLQQWPGGRSRFRPSLGTPSGLIVAWYEWLAEASGGCGLGATAIYLNLPNRSSNTSSMQAAACRLTRFKAKLHQDGLYRKNRATYHKVDHLNGEHNNDQGHKRDQQRPPFGNTQRFL